MSALTSFSVARTSPLSFPCASNVFGVQLVRAGTRTVVRDGRSRTNGGKSESTAVRRVESDEL